MTGTRFVGIASDELWECISKDAVTIVQKLGMLPSGLRNQNCLPSRAIPCECSLPASSQACIASICLSSPKDSFGWKHEPQTAASSSSPSLHYLKMYSLSVDACCPH